MPDNAVPVDVIDNGITWRVHPHHNIWESQTLIPEPQNAYMETQSMEAWEKQLLQHMEILVPMETITHHTQHQLIIASDGSVQDHRASFGWIIATPGGNRLAKCSGPAYGYNPSSYRAEGYGILSVIRFIHISRKKWGWTSTYTILCDNKAIVKILQDPIKQEDAYPNLAISAEWDILSEIRATLDHNMMRTSIQFQHIKGHADQDKPY
jgi:hypothetical protein